MTNAHLHKNAISVILTISRYNLFICDQNDFKRKVKGSVYFIVYLQILHFNLESRILGQNEVFVQIVKTVHFL